ncbi:MAG: hypothetical protein AAGB18_00285 [Pseudomonadota bacterium]
MREDGNQDQMGMGVFGRRSRMSGLTAAEVIALTLSALWLLGVTVLFFVIGAREMGGAPDSVRGLTVIFAVFMPIALIWVATMAASSARMMRAETRRLEDALDAMRQAYLAQKQAEGAATVSPSLERKLDQIAASQRAAGVAIANFAAQKAEAAPQTAEPEGAPVTETAAGAERGGLLAPRPGADGPLDPSQASLAFAEEEARVQPITIEDFITAMNFPKTAEDAAGFRALRRAMQDRRAASALQASQDLLTLLSQEGIYMDDLQPDPARPELWRRFAQGERGRAIAALGGIRDRSGIALTAARMRQDHIFRDTAHHFLRRFDQVFSEFEAHATDAEIAALADTRTARAFMLLGRVAGTFD